MDEGKIAALAGNKHIAVLISPRYFDARLETRFGIAAQEYFYL